MRLLSFRVVPLVAMLASASLLPAIASTSAAATKSIPAQATLIAQTPGLLESTAYPSTAYISAATGWTWGYNTNDNFDATASKGQTSFGFSLSGSSYTSVVHGTAKRVHLDLDLDGEANCDDGTNADVRDLSVNSSGQIQRLDLVFAALCGVPESDYVIGEFSYGEPSSTVSTWPGALYLPPTNTESTRTAFPVRLVRSGRGSTTISKVSVEGSAAADFAIAKDGCLGHAVTSASSCSVGVRYVGKRRSASATLVATTSSGAVVSRTPLDGADLPGSTYWAATDPVEDHSELVRSYRPGSQTEIWLTGAEPGTRELDLTVYNAHQSVGLIEWTFHKPVHAGTYRVKPGSQALQVSYSVNGYTQQVTSGIVRIAQLDLTRRDRGHERLPGFAISYELFSKPGMPTYGTFGYLTGVARQVPGFTTPPVASHVRVHRHGKTARIVWRASPDVAVHRYVVRVKRGVWRAVPWGGGHRVYSGAAHHFRLGRRHSGRPLTVSMFAVDDRHHHSRGRRIVLRR